MLIVKAWYRHQDDDYPHPYNQSLLTYITLIRHSLSIVTDTDEGVRIQINNDTSNPQYVSTVLKSIYTHTFTGDNDITDMIKVSDTIVSSHFLVPVSYTHGVEYYKVISHFFKDDSNIITIEISGSIPEILYYLRCSNWIKQKEKHLKDKKIVIEPLLTYQYFTETIEIPIKEI